jgi:alkaline phosphatase D
MSTVLAEWGGTSAPGLRPDVISARGAATGVRNPIRRPVSVSMRTSPSQAHRRFARIPLAWLSAWVVAQVITAGLALGQVLTHGPVVGGVTASDANVFVRTDRVATVEVRYGTDPNLSTYSTSQAFSTDPASDFTKIIPLADLTAETTYYLNVVVNAVPQLAAPYPSFTTFPPSGSARNFSFIVFTDFTTTSRLHAPSQTFASAAATNPAFVFIGGDFDHSNPGTLDDKRRMFKTLYDVNTQYIGDFVNLILRKMPIMHQWDDHDSGLNNDDKTYPDWSLSQRAFQEYVPSYPLPSVTPGIWQKFSYAQVDCFVLDCRSQRDPETDPDDANKSMLDGNNLGATGELQWLRDGLLASTARWKIVFTSVVINPTTKFPDGWAGYQTEWNALRNFINTNNIQGVVFISGDLHLGAIDNGTNAGFPEMCVSQPNGLGGCPTSPPGTWSEGYAQDNCKGFSLVTVSTDPDQLNLQVLDQFGNTSISYTVSDQPSPTPTPTPTPTATPTPTPSPPSITTQPRDRTVNVGQKAHFRVTATGTPPLRYQWTKNGVNITGATNASYTTPPTTPKDNGALFAVTVTNRVGSVTSNNATLTVH